MHGRPRRPAHGCRCGIYGALDGTVDSLPGYLADTSYETDPWCYAEMGCSGRVFVDMRGVRAERGELLQLALPEVPDADTRRALAERYGVPVVDAGEVPDWVTQNARQSGPPAEGVSLELNLAALEFSSEPLEN